jgi:twitching motility two-component system response regulator PilH
MTTPKILFCDDSITEPTYLKNILESAHCRLIVTKTGAEAVEKARSEKPDSIYMNILSLGTEGYAVMLSLRNHPETKKIPIIFYSGTHQTADSIWAKMQDGRSLQEAKHRFAETRCELAAEEKNSIFH